MRVLSWERNLFFYFLQKGQVNVMTWSYAHTNVHKNKNKKKKIEEMSPAAADMETHAQLLAHLAGPVSLAHTEVAMSRNRNKKKKTTSHIPIRTWFKWKSCRCNKRTFGGKNIMLIRLSIWSIRRLYFRSS